MNVEYQQWERRSSARHPIPGKLWWLGERDENFSPAWTADKSRSGIAFISSAAGQLKEGETVSVTQTHPREPDVVCDTYRVCRIQPYGPSLQLVACTRFL